MVSAYLLGMKRTKRTTVTLSLALVDIITELSIEHKLTFSQMLERVAREGILRYTTRQENGDGNH